MKFVFCFAAFIVGCVMTVFMKANAPQNAEANNAAAGYSAHQPKQAVANKRQESIHMDIVSRPYGSTKDGKQVTQYTCKNANGYVLEMVDYGAIVTAFRAPDKEGLVENITLCCNDIEGYEACTSYFGSTVGRYCNRIAKGKFSIDGTESTLATNNGENHLHGGVSGFDKRIWKAEKILDTKYVGLRFSLVSADGDQGYPGEVNATVEYILNNDNELRIDLKATTDKPTHINLANHNYWNLGGSGSGKILDHTLKLECDQYTPVDAQGIPTGEIASVEGTVFDFRNATKIGSRIAQIKTDPVGYDHNYALQTQDGKMNLVATVVCEESGRKMEIHSTQPGIQFYTGNFLDGQPGSGGFNQYEAFCLETQHYPDSPNQASFPSTLLKPGETYRQTTIHKFSTK